MIQKIKRAFKQIRIMPEDLEGIAKNHRQDAFIFFLVLICTTCVCIFFRGIVPNPDLNITMFYILGNFLVARYTAGYAFGFAFSFASVLSVNFFFTYPFQDFNFLLDGYLVTFFAMLGISMATSALTTSMKHQARILAKQEKELLQAQKEKMRANLLRAVSHDIRTPLTGIIGNSASYLEMEKKLSDEDKRNIVENIENDANWLLNMVENLLTVTRIDNETAKVSKTLEAVDEVISSAVYRFKKRFPDAEVKVKLPHNLIFIMMDAMLIEQVIINILQNAQVHAYSKKPLELSVYEGELNVEFEIKDYGIGIGKNRLETIFDGEDYQDSGVDTESRKGMGIGLSICKTIVLAHGGKIRAKNHEEGTAFIFSLPKETEA